MPARILAAPFILIAIVFLYLAFEEDGIYATYALPCLLVLAVIYIMSPQINWRWYQRNPPELKGGIRHLLNTRFPFYQNLSLIEKERFRNRTALYMEATNCSAQGSESVPIDVYGLTSASAVWLTFGQEDFLLSKFESIIIYPHPFPSPQYPEHWHSSEIFEEDGVILLSAEHLMKGFLEPKKYFHTGLYEYAKVYQKCYPKKQYPILDQGVWKALVKISNFPKAAVEKWIGLPEVDLFAVCVVYFFVFPKQFHAVLPSIFEQLKNIFNQNPILASQEELISIQ